MTTTDANGIVFLQDTDDISPFHTLINGLQTATSAAIANTRLGGGITPSTAAAFGSGTYIGQYIDDPTLGLLRWDGTAWRANLALGAWTAVPLSSGYGAYVVGGSTFTAPAVRVVGDEVEMSSGLVSYASAAALTAGTTYAINTGAPLASTYWPMDTHVASGAGGVHYNAALTPAEIRVTNAGLVQYVPSAAGSFTGTTSSWVVIPAMRWRKS